MRSAHCALLAGFWRSLETGRCHAAGALAGADSGQRAVQFTHLSVAATNGTALYTSAGRAWLRRRGQVSTYLQLCSSRMASHTVVFQSVRVRVVALTPCTHKQMHGKFWEAYEPTIERSSSKEVVVNDDGDTCLVNFNDPAGQEEYAALRDYQIRTSDGFLLVYSIDSRSSFDELGALREAILRAREDDHASAAAIVICGNKCDLSDDRREVSREEGESFARQFNVAFFETSAKTADNVEAAVIQLARLVRARCSSSLPVPAKALSAKKPCTIC